MSTPLSSQNLSSEVFLSLCKKPVLFGGGVEESFRSYYVDADVSPETYAPDRMD
jgi:hypothetical protein